MNSEFFTQLAGDARLRQIISHKPSRSNERSFSNIRDVEGGSHINSFPETKAGPVGKEARGAGTERRCANS